ERSAFREIEMRWMLPLYCMTFLPLSQPAFTQTNVPKGSEQKNINNKDIKNDSIASKQIDKVLVHNKVHKMQIIIGLE
ncbi:hypothetical protein RA269_29720, partial [Pseudomonas syringae pv. tagetis]